jgi:hypothetical protein
MAKLLPKKKRKTKKKKAEETPPEPPKPPKPKRKLHRRPAVPAEPEQPAAPILQRDAPLQFESFPERAVNSTELLVVIDVSRQSLPLVHETVWDTLVWANQYPALTIHFVTGPPARTQLLGEAKQRRDKAQSTIDILEADTGIMYKWEIPKHNENLLICRKRTE